MNFSWNECIEFAMKEGVVRVRQIREEDIEKAMNELKRLWEN